MRARRELPVERRRDAEVPVDARPRPTARSYVDVHRLRLASAPPGSAERWARAMFEDGRPVLRRVRALGVLGLLISAPGDAHHVAGWRVLEESPQAIRLSSSTDLMTDHVVVTLDADGVTLTTQVEHHSARGRWLWRVMAPLHRHLAPQVLRRAARSLMRPSHRDRGTPDEARPS